jgi:hypothetical protein
LGLRETRYKGTGEDSITRSFMICLTKCNSGDNIKKDEVDRAFGIFGSEEWCIKGFGGETWGKETTWKT